MNSLNGKLSLDRAVLIRTACGGKQHRLTACVGENKGPALSPPSGLLSLVKVSQTSDKPEGEHGGPTKL